MILSRFIYETFINEALSYFIVHIWTILLRYPLNLYIYLRFLVD